MPVRLTVLTIRPTTALARDAYDDVIANLLGRPGLDLVLLEHMPSQSSPDTERLALEGLQGTVATVAWCDAETLASSLNDAAEAGSQSTRFVRRPHAADSQADSWQPQPDHIGLFHFDMHQQSAESLHQDLVSLLASQQTRTFGITLPTAPNTITDRVAPSPAKIAATPPPVKANTSQTPPASPNKNVDHDQLDQWVDDLDELEL